MIYTFPCSRMDLRWLTPEYKNRKSNSFRFMKTVYMKNILKIILISQVIPIRVK